jgi:hypothetical protein
MYFQVSVPYPDHPLPSTDSSWGKFGTTKVAPNIRIAAQRNEAERHGSDTARDAVAQDGDLSKFIL